MTEDQTQEIEQPPETAMAVAQPVLLPRAGQPSLREVYWMAKALSQAVTLPDAIRGDPPAILAVMLAGRELGLGPMAATRMVHIISGQTSIATELKLALAKRTGHEVIPLREGQGWCVAGCRQHPDAEPFGWAIDQAAAERARAAGVDLPLTIAAEIVQKTKNGPQPLTEKDNWRNYGRSMVWWRASGDFMRRHCPGVGGGLVTVEELGEGGGDE